ncbi:MAG: alpha/beta hydrolase family protein [Treponemataceae bacterium]|nr:MAG: alpha/beta hydrolase family protein [Treponemataceae bacterium]
MALFQIEYYSDILAMDRNVNVIIPDKGKLASGETLCDIPVLYLLHGMGANHNTWLKRSGIDRLVRYAKLAVVMPSSDMAFYTNTHYGMKYFDALAVELPDRLQEFFSFFSASREKNYVAGFSMGGYGAYKMALRTNRFGYAASLSGALSFEGFNPLDIAGSAYWNGIFGDMNHFETSADNLLICAQNKIAAGETLPKLYAWCGAQDFLYQANVYAADALHNLGYDITFETSEGTHDWDYWAKQIETILQWLPISS